MTEAEKAVLRDAKFNEWNKRKSIRDRIVNVRHCICGVYHRCVFQMYHDS